MSACGYVLKNSSGQGRSPRRPEASDFPGAWVRVVSHLLWVLGDELGSFCENSICSLLSQLSCPRIFPVSLSTGVTIITYFLWYLSTLLALLPIWPGSHKSPSAQRVLSVPWSIHEASLCPQSQSPPTRPVSTEFSSFFQFHKNKVTQEGLFYVIFFTQG